MVCHGDSRLGGRTETSSSLSKQLSFHSFHLRSSLSSSNNTALRHAKGIEVLPWRQQDIISEQVTVTEASHQVEDSEKSTDIDEKFNEVLKSDGDEYVSWLCTFCLHKHKSEHFAYNLMLVRSFLRTETALQFHFNGLYQTKKSIRTSIVIYNLSNLVTFRELNFT